MLGTGVIKATHFVVPEQLNHAVGEASCLSEPTLVKSRLVEGQQAVCDKRVVLQIAGQFGLSRPESSQKLAVGPHGFQQEIGVLDGCVQVIWTFQCSTRLGKTPEHHAVPRRQHFVVQQRMNTLLPVIEQRLFAPLHNVYQPV